MIPNSKLQDSLKINMDKLESMNSNWDKLSTISAFDTGSCDESHKNEAPYNNHIIKHTSVTTPVSLLIQSLVHQLCIMLEKDHTRATNLYKNICDKLHEMKLLDENYGKGEFEIMRSQYQRALCQLIEVTSNPEMSVNISSPWSVSASSIFSWSRYYSDFSEVSFIAKGGFGSVYKARNNIDEIDYAIKKINIHFKEIDSISNHLAEVQTFASLSHPNIVSYKSAWLEPLINYQSATATYPNSSSSKSKSSYVEESSGYLVKSEESSKFEIQFQDSKDKNISSTNNNIVKETLSVTESIENCKVICKLTDAGSKNLLESAHVNLDWATLFIQMSLCDKTLKTWLEDRNSKMMKNDIFKLNSPHMQEVLNIFSQLTNGLHYIHNRQIIHHDVKPSNIFIGEDSGSITVQLGDFGLACPQQRIHHTGAFGTCLYAAPEQLKGICHVKNDIYSIGLVLYELVELFNTNMEKVVSFTKLRDEGHISENVTENCPKLANVIHGLLETDINERLDTSQLLLMLKALKDTKDSEIRALKEELRAKNEEIALLKHQLSLK